MSEEKKVLTDEELKDANGGFVLDEPLRGVTVAVRTDEAASMAVGFVKEFGDILPQRNGELSSDKVEEYLPNDVR